MRAAAVTPEPYGAILGELRWRERLKHLSPMARAFVRAERIKRRHRPGGPMWKRCVEFRNSIIDGLSEQEFWHARDVIVQERKREGFAR